jgi:hypothetical protein
MAQAIERSQMTAMRGQCVWGVCVHHMLLCECASADQSVTGANCTVEADAVLPTTP